MVICLEQRKLLRWPGRMDRVPAFRSGRDAHGSMHSSLQRSLIERHEKLQGELAAKKGDAGGNLRNQD